MNKILCKNTKSIQYEISDVKGEQSLWYYVSKKKYGYIYIYI